MQKTKTEGVDRQVGGWKPYKVAIILGLFALAPAWLAYTAVPDSQSLPSSAANLVLNPGFERGLQPWSLREGTTGAALDKVCRYGGMASLRLEGTGGKEGVRQDLKLAQPANLVEVAYWGRIAARPPRGARVGVDLGLTLSTGETVWFMPTSLRLDRRAPEEWHYCEATYRPPPGVTVTAIRVYCLNYRSRTTAWFDDLQLVARRVAEPTVEEISVLEPRSSLGKARWGAIELALREGRKNWAVVPRWASFEKSRLVIVPEWFEDEKFFLRLKYFWYLGGRLLLCDLPDKPQAKGLRSYLWTEDRRQPIQWSSERRACLMEGDPPEPEMVLKVVEELLRASFDLPSAVPARSYPQRRQIALREGTLYVDGSPVLLRAAGAYQLDASDQWARDLAGFRHLGLNAVVAYVPVDLPPARFEEFLNLAQDQGMLVIVWLKGRGYVHHSSRPWKDEWVLKFVPYREHPALFAWLISDDTGPQHLSVLKRLASVIRRYDSANFITATLLSLRRPATLSKSQWEEWRRLLDYPTTYLYPLQKGKTLGGYEDIQGGLEDVQRLAENTRRIWGKKVYFHQWCQAHMQTFAQRAVELAGAGILLPSPEQQRLLTYMTIASGTAGLLYFYAGALSEEQLGLGRRSEIGLVWRELALVEDLLTTGERRQAKTNQSSVEAVAFAKGAEAAVLLIRHHRQDNRYVADHPLLKVEVELELPPSAGAKVYRLGYPDLAELKAFRRSRGRLGVTVPDFDLTDLLLVTSEAQRLQRVQQRLEEERGAAARLALDALRDKRAKTEAVAQLVGDWADARVRTLLGQGQELHREAQAKLAERDIAASFVLSRQGLRIYREVQRRLMERAEDFVRERKLPLEAVRLTNIVFSLPALYARYVVKRAWRPGELREAVRERLK